ncbi:MAG: Trm112 family protein, partial [Nitrososphaerota archaeon]
PSEKISRCELYCSFHDIDLTKTDRNPECVKCYGVEIKDALIICEECGRWYPVEEEIPRMLPDHLRNKNEDLEFLARWKNKTPEKILTEGKPFSLEKSM